MTDTLSGLTAGVYLVTTRNGTRHIVDLDRRSVRRYGAPGREWTSLMAPDGVADGEEFFFSTLAGATVGSSMRMVANGSYLDPDFWRLTSTIASIGPYDATTAPLEKV